MALRLLCGNARQVDKISRIHTVVGATSSTRHNNRLHQAAAVMPTFCSEDRESSAVHTVQGVQGDVDLKEALIIARSKYVLAKVLEQSKMSKTERRDCVLQGVQGEVTYANRRSRSNSEGDPHVHVMTAGANVSLHSVMQSNVPEPFNPSSRGTPDHMNMPGGGILRQDKYTYNSVQSCHPSRGYSSLSGNQNDFPAHLSVSGLGSDLVGIRQAHSKGSSSEKE